MKDSSRTAAALAAQKLVALKGSPLFPLLSLDSQRFLEKLACTYRFTTQELRFLLETARNLEQWQENPLPVLWRKLIKAVPTLADKRTEKRQALDLLRKEVTLLLERPKSYPASGLLPPPKAPLQVELRSGRPLVLGACPVYSEKTCCCGLKTMDVVENCPFSCSYCTIQTFYGQQAVFHKDLPQQLRQLKLEPNRRYHIGIGQASDALAWGNAQGILDALVDFAATQPKVLLELKSKAAKIDYFFNHVIPPNLICSWTLNTATVAKNEEHFAAPLPERLAAAREVAKLGVSTAFHFHPLVFYQNWEAEYQEVAQQLMDSLDPQRVLFLSLGTVTFIKPVLKAIRRQVLATKITQMPLTPDPHGRLTYPDATKTLLYRGLLRALAPWRDSVFIYLCMEKPSIWKELFGQAYQDNRQFEEALFNAAFSKIRPKSCEATLC